MRHILKQKINISKRLLLRVALFVFITFHITAIMINAIGSTRDVYMRFYDLKETSSIFKFICKANFWPVFTHYASVSGTDCGFGFFAPNVRSNSVLVVQGCKNRLTPMFNTHEGEQRFSGWVCGCCADADLALLQLSITGWSGGVRNVTLDDEPGLRLGERLGCQCWRTVIKEPHDKTVYRLS